jgi:hypothetical protein
MQVFTDLALPTILLKLCSVKLKSPAQETAKLSTPGESNPVCFIKKYHNFRRPHPPYWDFDGSSRKLTGELLREHSFAWVIAPYNQNLQKGSILIHPVARGTQIFTPEQKTAQVFISWSTLSFFVSGSFYFVMQVELCLAV